MPAVLVLLVGELKRGTREVTLPASCLLGSLQGSVGLIVAKSLGNEVYHSPRLVYVAPLSLLSLSSCPSSYSFPGIISSTLCLSGT